MFLAPMGPAVVSAEDGLNIREKILPRQRMVLMERDGDRAPAEGGAQITVVVRDCADQNAPADDLPPAPFYAVPNFAEAGHAGVVRQCVLAFFEPVRQTAVRRNYFVAVAAMLGQQSCVGKL